MKENGMNMDFPGDSRSGSSLWAGFIVALSLVLPSAQARADDLPLPAPFSALGSLPTPFSFILPNYRTQANTYAFEGFFASPLFSYQSAQFRGDGGHYLKDVRGISIGAGAGYNFQVERLVFGPAADISYSFMEASEYNRIANVTKAEIDWYGSARGRLGYTFDRFLVYGTGGFAFAETTIHSLLGTSKETLPGWTAGGGLQFLWSEQAIFEIEYRRIELQERDFNVLPAHLTKVGVTMNVIKAGFSRKF